jgi:hypothetical protein
MTHAFFVKLCDFSGTIGGQIAYVPVEQHVFQGLPDLASNEKNGRQVYGGVDQKPPAVVIWHPAADLQDLGARRFAHQFDVFEIASPRLLIGCSTMAAIGLERHDSERLV